MSKKEEQLSELEVRKAVKERYSKLATGSGGCCGDRKNSEESRLVDCSSSSSGLITVGDSIPHEATSINAGCGSPLELVKPREGDHVLDLGSGGGIDVFRASGLVGKTGRATGVDSTPEMVWRARETRAKYADKYTNVDFRLGEIEQLPIETNSVDYVISNCVINLSPDKLQVFKEALRVLKPNGTFAVADVTAEKAVPTDIKDKMEEWSSCISGALSDDEYMSLLFEAGFEKINIEHISEASMLESKLSHQQFKFYNSHIIAVKK